MQNLLIGSLLTIATAVIHAGFMLLLMDSLRVTQPKAWNLHRRSVRATLIACTVLMIAMASILESALWRRPTSQLALSRAASRQLSTSPP